MYRTYLNLPTSGVCNSAFLVATILFFNHAFWHRLNSTGHDDQVDFLVLLALWKIDYETAGKAGSS
jgi:hypothetical protein